MGKAARAACILTPMLLTLASFVCLLLVELGGLSKGNDTLNDFHFVSANLTDIHSNSDSSSILSTAIDDVKTSGALADVYDIYLWNYCSSNKTSGKIDYCSKRKADFVFDPVTVWGLEAANATATSTSDNALESAVAAVKDDLSEYEEELLGKSGKKAIKLYKEVGKYMFIAYQVSFWTTLATLVVGLLAVCSRWGSFLTWITALVSSVFTFIAVLMSTIIYTVFTKALNKVLKDYGIVLTTTKSTLVVTWLAVLFSFAATFFWLFSVCCCSGRSNPHHKNNKNGLWNAEPKGQGYGNIAPRGLNTEKGGNGYERVASPYAHEDQMPMREFPQPTGYAPREEGLEPYRHA